MTELTAKKIFSRHSTVLTLFGLTWSEQVWPPIYLISRTIFHFRYAVLGAFSLSPSGFQQPLWPAVFPMGGLRPSVCQVVEFSDPSFVFAHARDGHNTIFCPFRFKSAVLVLLLDG